MDERLQFVARRLAGEPMAELCRKFGISRKTGYKIFDRYQECGLEGLSEFVSPTLFRVCSATFAPAWDAMTASLDRKPESNCFH